MVIYFQLAKKLLYTIESKEASTTAYSDSGRGTMTQSTIADNEEPDHTFNSVHHHDTILYSTIIAIVHHNILF